MFRIKRRSVFYHLACIILLFVSFITEEGREEKNGKGLCDSHYYKEINLDFLTNSQFL